MRETKIVNLDDQNKAVDIVMGGKTFTISRITLQLTKLYGEYMIFCGEYAKSMAEVVKASEEKKDINGLQEVAEKQSLLIESFAREKAERIQRMLTIILEKNGYAFDQAWWEENARYQDMEAFIFQALKKDEADTPKKKEVEVMAS